MDDLGVYVLLSSDGKLKRDLAALNGKIPLEDSTVEQEIIEFSELLYGPYWHDHRTNAGDRILSGFGQPDPE